MRFRRLAEERLAGRFRVRRARPARPRPLRLGGAVDDRAARRGRARDRLGAGAWIGHSFGGTARRGDHRAPAGARRARRPARPRALGSAGLRREIARGELAKEPYASGGGAPAREASVEHTPREFLEEEIREHLVEQPDGGWFYRYSTEPPSRRPTARWRRRRLVGRRCASDAPRRRRARQARQRRRARGLPRRARRPPRGRGRPGRAHRPLGRLRGDRRGDRPTSSPRGSWRRRRSRPARPRARPSRCRGRGSGSPRRSRGAQEPDSATSSSARWASR